MPTIRRVLAGKKSKLNGQMFENLLESSAYRQGWEVIKIPDGCRQIGQGKMIRISSPFDFVMVKKGHCLFIDAKSCIAKSFGNSMITPHQVLKLSRVQACGFLSGYICNFSSLNKVVFFPASQLYGLKHMESLKPEMGVMIGDRENINLNLLVQDL